MERQAILDQITQVFGSVPVWLDGVSNEQLEHVWGELLWFLTDTKLSSRDKALVAFGAATANHCVY
jgi:hypothetical protein